MKEQARGWCSPTIPTVCSLISAVLGSGGKPGPWCCPHHPIAHGTMAGAQSPAAGLGNRMGCTDGDRRGRTGGTCRRRGRSGGRAGEEPCSQISSLLGLQALQPRDLSNRCEGKHFFFLLGICFCFRSVQFPQR